MQNFDEYVVFVIRSKIAGQKIEIYCGVYGWKEIQYPYKNIEWDWYNKNYRVKLPEGWEYVLEDEELAFRNPKENETILKLNGTPLTCTFATNEKSPIIKRKDKQ